MSYRIFYSCSLVSSENKIFKVDNNTIMGGFPSIEAIENLAIKRMFGDNSNDIAKASKGIEDGKLFLVFTAFTVTP